MLRNDWTEAWEREDAPKPLGMPLQGMVTMDAIARTGRYASSPHAQAVGFNPIGQTVGLIHEVQSCREVIYELVEGYVEASERLAKLQPR